MNSGFALSQAPASSTRLALRAQASRPDEPPLRVPALWRVPAGVAALGAMVFAMALASSPLVAGLGLAVVAAAWAVAVGRLWLHLAGGWAGELAGLGHEGLVPASAWSVGLAGVMVTFALLVAAVALVLRRPELAMAGQTGLAAPALVVVALAEALCGLAMLSHLLRGRGRHRAPTTAVLAAFGLGLAVLLLGVSHALQASSAGRATLGLLPLGVLAWMLLGALATRVAMAARQ